MRILICTQEAPCTPTNGFVLQVEAILAELRSEHEVRVVALSFPHQETSGAKADGIRLVPAVPSARTCRAVGRAAAASRGRPFGWLELASRLAEPLEQELERFRPDVVHVAGVLLASLGRRLLHRVALIAPLDAAHLNAEARALRSSGLRCWLDRRAVAHIRRYEALEYRHFRCVVVVSEADGAALMELEPRVRVAVIPNGVDTMRFAPSPTSAADRNRVIFAGVMNTAPNVSAAEFLAQEVMPRVRSLIPCAQLAIVGRAPIRAVRRLAQEPGVEVIGEVDDMRAWLTASRVCACPMVSGTGIKNKVLEAMACGVPCVVTPRALSGLGAIPGRDLLVGESPADLASSIARLLRNERAAQEVGAAGRAYVVTRHDWSDAADAYVQLYETLIAEARLDDYKSLSQVWRERPPSIGIRAPVT
jgi:glycosyltransferase involved in cell wall biosynthesis